MNTTKTETSCMTQGRTGIEKVRAEAIILQKYLVKQLQQVLRAASGTPNVVFTVTKFHAIGEAGNPKTRFYMALAQHNDRVSLSPARNPTTIEVRKDGPLNIRFTIKGNSAADLYVPVGVTFNLNPKKSGQGKDPDKNFPSQYLSHSGASLNFMDAYLGDGDLYDFYVVIRRQSDRRLGIIDPGIQHVN
jgi:hypothetical protein